MKAPQRARWSDDRIDVLLGRLLQVGVSAAAVVVAVGGVRYLLVHGLQPPDFSHFHSEPDELRSVSGIFRAAAAFRPRGLISLGLVLLVLTPVARVALLTVTFAVQRDRLYVGLSLLVLMLLAFSILAGR